MSITHEELVKAISKPGEDILATLSPEKANLVHMALGIAGESGELVDAIKKHIIYGKQIDLVNVVEELGDIEFFLEGIRQSFDLTREETILGNIEKLSKRYATLSYSDKQAQERADKA